MRALAILGGLFVVVLVAGLVAFLLLSRPGSGEVTPAAPSPATSTAAPGTTDAQNAAPPSDLASGEAWLPGVDLRSARLFSDGRDLRDVHVTGSGARVAKDGTITADRLELDAVVPFAAVEQEVGRGLRLAPAEDGMVAVRMPLGVLGRTIDLSAVARVTAEGDRIAVDPVRVVGGGDLVGGAVERLPAIRRPVPGLPAGMSLTRVAVTDAGFAVHATGENVTVQR